MTPLEWVLTGIAGAVVLAALWRLAARQARAADELEDRLANAERRRQQDRIP